MKEIEILMMDGCTRAEAKRFLEKNNVIIFDDFEENFENYMQEWNIEEEDILNYKKMIDEGKPIQDWGIVNDKGKTYYIMYIL